MTTKVRFGESVSGLLDESAGDFMDAVAWRSSGSVLRNGKGRTDSDLSVRTIGMCWKQQCLELVRPELRTGAAGFHSLDESIEAAEPGSIVEILGSIRSETVPLRRRPGGNLKKQTRQKSKLSPGSVDSLRTWLDDAGSQAKSSPVSLLACCELLVLYGSQLPAEVAGGLWRVSLAAALEQANGFFAESETEDWQEKLDDFADSGDSGDSDDSDHSDHSDHSRWLQAGLLPWVCGLLFDDVKGAPKLARTGRTSLNAQLMHVTDEDGVPVSEVFESVSTFLSFWTDALLVAELFGQSLFRKDAAKRFEKTLRRLAANASRHGVQGCLDDGAMASERLLQAAGHLGVSSKESWLRCLEESSGTVRRPAGGKSSKKKQQNKATRRPLKKVAKKDIPSWQSDDTDSACLRTLWTPDASVATLLFNGDPVRLDLAADGVPVLAGDWDIALAEDDEELEFSEAWECVCWHSDDDGDYCELQFEFEGGPKINRQLLLSRQKQFAVIADAVAGTSAERVDLVSLLPLAEGVSVKETPGTREVILQGREKRVRVFPLALPQDRGLGTDGSAGFDEESGERCLAVSQASATGGLFSPIVLDWNPARRDSPAEWRQLTVTEAGEIDRTGSAAFRLKVGTLHLVLYRGLKATDRYRTFLGYQCEAETVFGEFGGSGEIDELVTVE